MLIVKSDNFDEFVCKAGECPESCCSGGWEIIIDDDSMKRYTSDTGDAELNERLANGLTHNDDGYMFRQNGRDCCMLDPDGLCSIQKSLGEEGLCSTCSRYPRHVEEFEGIREWSLSLSCPEAARIILSRTEPLGFLEAKTDEEEADGEYEEFDNMFYSMLNDARNKIFGIIQDRSLSFREKAVRIEEFCMALQDCIDQDRLFDMDALIYDGEGDSTSEDYQEAEDETAESSSEDGAADASAENEAVGTSDAYESCFAEKYAENGPGSMADEAAEELAADGIHVIDETLEINHDPLHKNLFKVMFELEVLKGDWEDITERTWSEWDDDLKLSAEQEIQAEQLLMFWTYTYFCGAAYDGWIFSKAMLAICSTWWILQINAANSFEGGIIEAAYRYAREIEHSDENLNALEEWFMRRE